MRPSLFWNKSMKSPHHLFHDRSKFIRPIAAWTVQKVEVSMWIFFLIFLQHFPQVFHPLMNGMKYGWCQKMGKRELAWFLNYSAVNWQFPPTSAPNHMPTDKDQRWSAKKYGLKTSEISESGNVFLIIWEICITLDKKYSVEYLFLLLPVHSATKISKINLHNKIRHTTTCQPSNIRDYTWSNFKINLEIWTYAKRQISEMTIHKCWKV